MPDPNQVFVRACRGQSVEVTPVWIMRQAGRYMPEYRAIRRHHALLEICRRPELAAEVTITAAEYLKVDAAIIFADLLLPVAPLGLELAFAPGEGPVVTPPLRTPEQIARLPLDWGNTLGFVAAAIQRVAAHFGPGLPVIGFAGAPFTLASYLIEGGASRHYIHTKRLMRNHPGAWRQLMETLTAGLAEFVGEQVAAGAAVIQFFDSWAGALSEWDFRNFVLPHTRELVRATRARNVPVIYFSTGTGGYLNAVAETGADVLGLDWRIELETAWRELGQRAPALQGNLDPVLLLSEQAALRVETHRILAQSRGRRGYIFNLGHGVLPETDPETVRALVEWVHAFR